MLRPSFYENIGKADCKSDCCKIVTTISDTTYKGLDVILKTAKILKMHTNLNFEWNVVGVSSDSRLISFFERIYKIKGINYNIKYRGVLNEQDLCNTMLDMHLYIHPTYIDNSPNAVCEAQLLGIPVISTNVGGTASLVKDKETGILVPSNAPYETAYWIIELMSNKKLYEFIRINAIQVAERRHNRDNIRTALIHTYQDIIQRYRK